jgi:hypothetical protein
MAMIVEAIKYPSVPRQQIIDAFGKRITNLSGGRQSVWQFVQHVSSMYPSIAPTLQAPPI